jgi:hypothetical protein
MAQILVLSNGAFNPIKGTPWEDVVKKKGFRAIMPRMQEGKCGLYHDHWFKFAGPRKQGENH